jgi:hypothetical protein
MAVATVQQVASTARAEARDGAGARDRLCSVLRNAMASPPSVAEDVLAAARAEELHLLLADRLRLSSLAEELRTAAAVEILRERELRGVLSGLATAGIKPILIKGAALARTHYPRPELRPRVDTDLMISMAERDQTARALRSLGYQRASEIAGDVAIGQFHFHRVDRSGLLHALDVHWRVSNVHAFAGALTYEELARDAVSLPSLGANGWGPSAVHALFVACIHRVAHHGDSVDLLWLFDVHLLARDLSLHEQRSFTELATTRRMRRVCARGLQLAADAFGGIDDAWISSLEDGSDASESSAMFVGQDLRQVDILKADFQALPQWRERAQLLREHLFPPAEYMRDKYRAWPGALLPLAYLYRIVRGSPRWFR